MKGLLMLLVVVLLAGCNSEIESKHITVGQFLCFDQDGIASIILDPVGTDLYICNDGSQFVIGYGSGDEDYYYIYHNTKDLKANEMLDRIMFPEKWAERDRISVAPYKDINRIMRPATDMFGEDRGL